MGDGERDATYELHDGERLTVVGRSPELLEARVEWAPASAPPLDHLHPEQDEVFAVEAGELTVSLDGARRVVRAGERVEVPRGVRHRMWNSGSEPCRATWQVRPALRTEGFWRDVHERRRTAPVDAHGMLKLLAAAPLLAAYTREFRPALPGPLQVPAVKALALVARLRGY